MPASGRRAAQGLEQGDGGVDGPGAGDVAGCGGDDVVAAGQRIADVGGGFTDDPRDRGGATVYVNPALAAASVDEAADAKADKAKAAVDGDYENADTK